MQVTPSFPRIIVISLQEDQDRRRHIEEQFLRFPSLQYEFFDAIRISSRHEFPQDYDIRRRKFLFGDDLRPGEVGCFLSHREVWRQCAQSDDEAWCILEDDVQLLDEFEQRVRLLMRHSERWDVVRLMALLQRKGSWIHAHLDAEHALLAYDRQPSGAQGYLLKPSAARRLAEHASRIVWPIDETLDLYWEHKQRLYSLAPAAIAVEASLDSTIGTRSSKRRPKWRKVQRELINGMQGARRRLFNLRRHGLAAWTAPRPEQARDSQ